MFRNCYEFTGKGLEQWNVSKVQNFYYMFEGCKKFNADLSNWDAAGKKMDFMFVGCYSLTYMPDWYKNK